MNLYSNCLNPLPLSCRLQVASCNLQHATCNKSEKVKISYVYSIQNFIAITLSYTYRKFYFS